MVHPAVTFAVRVTGDGLLGSGVHNGDVLLVDRALHPDPGLLVVVVHEGQHRAGRLIVGGGRAALATDDQVVPLGEGIQRWGVVVAVVRSVVRPR